MMSLPICSRAPAFREESGLEEEHGKLAYSFDVRVAGAKNIAEMRISEIYDCVAAFEKESAESEAKYKEARAI